MKYNLSKPITIGARRTLDAFSKTMFMLLSGKAFEEITVGELCDNAQYPRATFYNYFDDKYDLLNYCWISLAERIGLSEYHHAAENEMLFFYFDRIYDFSKEHSKAICLALDYNPEVGYMFSSFRNFLNSQVRRIFKDCPDAKQKDIPNELLADHYSNTLFLIWQWSFVNAEGCSKERAHSYLKLLLKV